jgi:hypothetical protein
VKPVFKRLLIVVIILLALLLAAEVGLTLAAQKGLAVYLRDRFSLEKEPSVSISSFPITVNALRGRINSTRVQISSTVPATGLAGLPTLLSYELAFDVTDARFSLTDLLSRHLRLQSVGRLEATLRLTRESLNSFLAGSGWSLSLEGDLLYVLPDAAPGQRIECKVYVYDSSTLALEPRAGTTAFPPGLAASGPSLLLKLPVQGLPMHPTLLSAGVSGGLLTLKARLDQSQLLQSGSQAKLNL